MKAARYWTCALLIFSLAVSNHRFSRAEEFEGFGDEQDDVIDAESSFEGSEPVRKIETKLDDGDDRSQDASWDEDEFEGFTEENELKIPIKGQEKLPSDAQSIPRKRSVFKRQEHYYYEIAALVVLVIYGMNVFVGKNKNESIALAWARVYVGDGGILERNFSLLGPGDADDGEVLMKESQSMFKFYASGRRYCHGFMATLDLKARQDLLSMLFYLVSPREDTVEVEVYMNEGNMPQIVLGLATQKLMRNLSKDAHDLKTFGKQISVKQIQDWPGEQLSVWTESAEVFYDLFSPEIRPLFTGAGFESTGKYFRCLHFSSEYTASTHRKILKFSFALPPPDQMEDISKLMAMIPLFIDLVGTYKLSPEAKKRADKNRAEEAERAWKEGADARREALQQKKRDELEAEIERIKKLPPEEQARWAEKQQKVKQRRTMKVKMVRA